MDVLAIITARGGSKRLPGKNIKMLHGKPLIAWTIEAAKDCYRTVVTTDSKEIAAIGKHYGCEVLMRPDELARDDTRSIEVIIHALSRLEWESNFVLLQPTSPLRTSEDIINAYNLFKVTGARNVVSINENYKPNGAIYLCDNSYWSDTYAFYGENTFPYFMSTERSIDIDTIEDFELAEKLMATM